MKPQKLGVTEGNLRGSTDSDYFYFFCPECGDTQILRILDYEVIKDEEPKRYLYLKTKKKRDFIKIFLLYCPKCKRRANVKISNIGWQRGKLKDSIIFHLTNTSID